MKINYRPPNRPHALYRFFDAEDVLLYVGRTVDPGSRWRAHSKGKPWWTDVFTVRVEHFPDLEAVTTAETRAIQTEHPKHNIVHARPAAPTPAETTPAPTVIGKVVALGLRDGRCPVGLVEAWGEFARLSLYSWTSEYFGHSTGAYRAEDIVEIRFAQRMTPEEVRAAGYSLKRHPVMFEMTPLARFQSRWQHQHGLITDEDLVRTVRIFGGAA